MGFTASDQFRPFLKGSPVASKVRRQSNRKCGGYFRAGYGFEQDGNSGHTPYGCRCCKRSPRNHSRILTDCSSREGRVYRSHSQTLRPCDISRSFSHPSLEVLPLNDEYKTKPEKPEFEDNVGPGFEAIPGVAEKQPGCGVDQVPRVKSPDSLRERQPESEAKPLWQGLFNVASIGIDRQSFLDRGWPNERLGAWNGGSSVARRGLFLSMFYALQNLHPQELGHPWNQGVHPWDRGLGAHIDHWKRLRCEREFYLYVNDHPIPLVGMAANVVGRTSNEMPFTQGPCGPKPGREILGCAGQFSTIFIRTDYSYSLGQRIDEPVWIRGSDGMYRINISYIIAHECGHFFGFPHVSSPANMMFESLPQIDAERPRWQTPDEQMRPLFDYIAGFLCEDL
jgi:hypothetical protein